MALGPLRDNSVVVEPGIGDGIRRYLSVRRLHGFGLSAVVGLDAREQLAAFERQKRAWLVAAGIGSAVLAIVVTLLSVWSWQAARARRSVRHAQETYAAASEASADAFFVLRSVFGGDGHITDFEIEMANSRAEQMTGVPREGLRGTLLCEMMPHYRRNGFLDAAITVALEGGMFQTEWQATAGAMRGCWLHCQVVQVDGGLFVIVRDITERKLTEERIVHMAHHDDLTGLPNRTLLRLRLDEAISRAGEKRQCVGLAFVDLDGFKLINDGLGHSAGDELLKVVGQRMRDGLRRNDMLARFGGDEFVLLLTGIGPDPQALAPLLDKLRHAVQEPVQVAGQSVRVSCSMGVVMYPRDGHDADTLLMNADAAMYRAKDGGRNNYQFYSREMNARGEENLALLDGLRRALDTTLRGTPGEHGFSLVYQPKIELATGRLFGVEALLRWHHPQHGMVPPQRFIGLAEESGLIVDIGSWVLRTACAQALAWRSAGLPPVTVSVNVSPRQFEENRLVERVASALADSGLPPDGLELEVTESLIMRDLVQSIAKMRELKQMGVSLSIDDFGTGYSSLSSLKSFPISRLKIDKSFISELAENEDDQAIAMAVISLGHKLNLRVIAEGVETEQQKSFLRAHECDEMQGYLFSKPVPPERIAEMLAADPLRACMTEAA
jgi:diguanylate cyclase (GGDEF)-like protein